MTAKLIDGNAIAEQLRSEVAGAVRERVAAGKSRPGLATVLVGENPASQSYVKSKRKASAEVGIETFGFELPATATQKEIEDLVTQLNQDPRVH